MVSHFPEPDIFTLNCPTQQILDLIADKWTVIILYCLVYRPKRYNEILHQIEGISAKVLTQSLRKLARYGLIQQQNLANKTTITYYALTPLGNSLMEPLSSLAAWSQQYFSEVIAAIERYDTPQET